MYPLIAKWTILPGNEKEATAALKKLALDVQEHEPDTWLYMVQTPNLKEKSLPSPPEGEVVFFEIYKDHAAFLTHINGADFKNFVKDSGHLFLQDFNTPSQVFMLTEVLSHLGGFVRNELK